MADLDGDREDLHWGRPPTDEEDPAEGAQARLNLAYRLVTRNQPGDLDRARPLLEHAQTKAQAVGLAGIAGRCRSLLDQLDTLRLS